MKSKIIAVVNQKGGAGNLGRRSHKEMPNHRAPPLAGPHLPPVIIEVEMLSDEVLDLLND